MPESLLSSTARGRAAQTLAAHARRYPDLRLEAFRDDDLSPRDAALAHAIIDQSVRCWITIEHLLQQKLKRPFRQHSPAVQAALLAGSAQLLFFDRLPAFAVVDETVERVKRSHGKKSAGLVNAILRRMMELIARDGEAPIHRERWTLQRDELPLPSGGAVALTEPALPENELERIAIAAGLPPDLLSQLQNSRSTPELVRLARHGLANPPTILNTAQARAPLPESDLTPHAMPGAHVFTGDPARLAELLQERDDIWAQDPTSAAAVQLAAGLTPRLIVDVCAGQGTKARQLRAMFPDARIIASDLHEGRRATLARLFADDPRVQTLAPDELLDHVGKADLVLLDVPCSNTGVLGRRVEARHRFNDKSMRSLLDTQRQIMADSIRLLAPGAHILYATCSVDPRENEQQTAWLTKWHDRKPLRQETRWPTGGPGEPPTESSDGGFAALLR